ncbi:MAG: hydrogen peroxide-inducible genes activator, partial [Bacteroidales bacterium]
VDREGGFTLLPELATLDMTADKRKQLKSFSHYTPLREVSLVYSRNFAKLRLLKLLVEEIRLSVPEMMLDKERGSIVEWKDA